MGIFKKSVLRLVRVGMLSFSPEVVPIGWTLIQERNFFARPSSTLTVWPKPRCDQKNGILCSANFPAATFGLVVKVEAGRPKKFLSSSNVHPMGTTSGENESILPALV